MAFQPSVEPNSWTFRQIVWATLVFVLVALGFWIIYRFNQVLFILFIAMVLGTVIRPAIIWLNRRGLPRTAGVILVYLLLLVFFIGFILLLFPLIIEQGTTIAADIPGYYQSLRGWMMNYPNILIVRLSEFIPAELPTLKPIEQTGLEVMASAGQALEYIKMAARAGFFAIVILLLAFYWTLDGPRTIKSLVVLFPQGQRNDINELVLAMEVKVGYYLVGQGVLCLAIGLVSLVAYLLIGLPNALALALVAGLLEAVPMIGPLLGFVPAALVAISIGPDKLIWLVVATVIIQQLENSFLVPRVMSKAVGVNPFVSLLAFFAFSTLLGLGGALMAIPMAAIIQLLFDRFVFQQSATETDILPGRDYASRLRYEAQDLAQDLRKQARLKKDGSAKIIRQTDHVLDEIETLTTDLDSLLAQLPTSSAP